MLQWKNSPKFAKKTLNFPTEIYRIEDESTHIFKLMYAILEIGMGQLSLWQDEANNSESIPGTQFSDLDSMFSFLGITRLPGEIYSYNPYTDQLTSTQWNEIFTKDALFRLRLIKFYQALLRGGTVEGIAMMAEAASGARCQVFEMWRVLNGRGLAVGSLLGRRDADGNLLLEVAKEFIIIPAEDIDDGQRAAIIHLVDILKPINTVCTVHTSPTIPLQEVVIRFSGSEDYYFEVRRMVTATDDIIFEGRKVKTQNKKNRNHKKRHWVRPGREVEGPTFARMSHHDTDWPLNGSITSIKTFKVDANYLTQYGTLTAAINASVETLQVDELSEPAAASFLIKIDDEQIFVTDRTPVVGQDARYEYTILRGQEGSTAASHLINAPVYRGLTPLYSTQNLGDSFGPWRAFPQADSPDNFPEGQFPGDPAKFDSEGHYLFEFPNQDTFNSWYTLQIQSINGEVNGTQYRLPLAIDTVGGLATIPEDALSEPEFVIQTRIFPDMF